MNEPTGAVTFLFTDIEGSTKLAQKFNETYPGALIKHNLILNEAVKSNNGFVFKTVGDAFCCAFQDANDALIAACDIQKLLLNENWKEVYIKVRIGIHSGNAEWNGEDYMGYITLARVSRVMSAANGEQIIISESTYELINDSVSDRISFRHLGERRLKDVIQPIKLYQIISPGLREDFPPLKTLDSRPNNLPVQLTDFIGCEESIKSVKHLLNQTRLLTLLGSGGVGKTRLAMQVGADMIDDFANGVFIAELAPVTDPDFILQTLMNSFGMKDERGKTAEVILTDHIKDKELLLILDNCEHLIKKCALTVEMLLSNCAKLKIITTSREFLNCSGEKIYKVPSLSLPDVSVNITPMQLSQYESVRLFIERAIAVNRDFRLNNENAQSLAEICSRLDGIPLAIELAAARIKVLTVEKICERLANRFSLLTGGKRTALPRQQTLKAMIDWSYDLLSEKEKILWRRLSVFNGGWTMESAEEICSDDKIKGEEIIDLMNALTDKSIILYGTEKERYRILESLKQYGYDTLTDEFEKEDILRKHLTYFMEIAEASVPNLIGSEIQVNLEKLVSEHGNFQSAIEWSLSADETEKGARLAVALGNFWDIRGYYTLGIQLLGRFLTDTKGLNKSLEINLRRFSGILSADFGLYEQARKYFEECLTISREIGEKKGIAIALNQLGGTDSLFGKYKLAQVYYEECLNLFRELGDKDGLAACLHNFGNITGGLGNYEQAKKYMEESLAIRKDLGDKRGTASCLMSLGQIAYKHSESNYEQTKKFYEESISLSREIGLKRELAISLYNLGDCVENCDKNFEYALEYFEEALALFREMGNKIGIASSLNGIGNVLFRRSGKEDEAKKFYEKALILFRETGDKSGIANSLRGIGNVAFILSDYGEAKKHFEESLELRRETGNNENIAEALRSIGNVLLETGNHKQAQKFFKEALGLSIEMNNKSGILSSLIGVSMMLSSGNHFSKASQILGSVETAINTLNNGLGKIDLTFKKKIIKELQIKLSEKEFLKYFEEGKKMTLDEACQMIFDF